MYFFRTSASKLFNTPFLFSQLQEKSDVGAITGSQHNTGNVGGSDVISITALTLSLLVILFVIIIIILLAYIR